MTKVKSPHNADASFVGYLYQGQYALLLLQDASPDTSVAVETDDDVVLEGPSPTLVQLKHSSAKNPGSLTVKDAGWWKTLRIWVEHPRRAAADFLFITCAPIQHGSPLEALRPKAREAGTSLEPLADSLLQEAGRVKSERKKVQTTDPSKIPPHQEKAPGCEAVLAAGRSDLLQLLGQITIVDGAAPASRIEAEVIARLQKCVRSELCKPVAKRLMEWWDRQITLALLKQRDREIKQWEYTSRLHDLIQEHGEGRLPDDFGDRDPSSEELADELHTVMERQIHLVKGGQHRLDRAARDRWRARNQRNSWLEDDMSLGQELAAYDKRLVETWKDQHGPMIDDTLEHDDNAKRQGGLKILEWGYNAVHSAVKPPKPTWDQAFLARGQLQQLSEERQVGWHPDYLAELAKLDGEDES